MSDNMCTLTEDIDDGSPGAFTEESPCQICKFCHKKQILFSVEMKAKRPPDSRLEALVNRMFDKSVQSRYLKQVIGIVIECNIFDVMERAISMSTIISETLNYCLHVSYSNTQPGFFE